MNDRLRKGSVFSGHHFPDQVPDADIIADITQALAQI
jgi:hypothetical protein